MIIWIKYFSNLQSTARWTSLTYILLYVTGDFATNM